MDDSLQQGITAYRAEKRDEARKFFIAAVKQSQDDERAWGWMYNVCDNNKERTHCLKQMLRINPKNEKASQLLNELTAADFPLERPSTNIGSHPVVEQKPPTVPPVQTKQTIASQKKPNPKQQKNLQIGIVAFFFICIICLAITFMSGGGTSASPSDRCVPASTAQIEIIRSGIKGVDANNDIIAVWAVRSNDFSRVWFVAAEITGAGIESKSAIGVWTIPGELEQPSAGAWSVNGMANEFSDWGDGTSTQAQMSMDDDGAKEAESCALYK
jgi:hypothetical protein